MSVNTIRGWRKSGIPQYAQHRPEPDRSCPRCGNGPHEFHGDRQPTYAYLLGLYLGDGCLAKNKTSWSLRIALDAAYPGIVQECGEAVAVLCGRWPSMIRDVRDKNCIKLETTWKSWLCLFPQHGPGRKHHRPIVLADWQRELVDAHPGPFLRGLIHSDGWRGVNRVRAKGRDYEYPRYQFSNRSADIRKLFTDACDRLGVKWRPWTRFHVSVAQRESVAILDRYVGPKR